MFDDCLIHVFSFLQLCDLKKCLFVCKQWKNVAQYCYQKYQCQGIEIQWHKNNQTLKPIKKAKQLSENYPFLRDEMSQLENSVYHQNQNLKGYTKDFFDENDWVHLNDLGLILIPEINNCVVGVTVLSLFGYSKLIYSVIVSEKIWSCHWCKWNKTFVFHMDSPNDYFFDFSEFPLIKKSYSCKPFFNFPRYHGDNNGKCWYCARDNQNVSFFDLPPSDSEEFTVRVKYLTVERNSEKVIPLIAYHKPGYYLDKYLIDQNGETLMEIISLPSISSMRKKELVQYSGKLVQPKTQAYLAPRGDKFKIIYYNTEGVWYLLEGNQPILIKCDSKLGDLSQLRMLIICEHCLIGKPGLWFLFDENNIVLKLLTKKQSDWIPFFNKDIRKFQFIQSC